jgi:hypothetical protein
MSLDFPQRIDEYIVGGAQNAESATDGAYVRPSRKGRNLPCSTRAQIVNLSTYFVDRLFDR